MNRAYAQDLWKRAGKALEAAETLLAVSPDDAASRCYYAAFHAVSAWFALRGKAFKKHTAVRAAVHRDLVNTGIWPRELGEAFDAVCELRDVGDYGALQHVPREDAERAVEAARRIREAVLQAHPELADSEGDAL